VQDGHTQNRLLSMIMQEGAVTSSDALVSVDKLVVDICSICFAIPIFCDCPVPKPDMTVVR